MKKPKWMILFMLALPLATNIRASNCAAMQKTAVVVKIQPVNTPATLIEQILFPHGM